MVELDVVDFVGGACLEPFVDQIVLSICYPQLLVVEDASETGVRHETALRLVFVLEEWLNKKSTVLHVSADSQQDLVQLTLFGCCQLVAWVKYRRNFEFSKCLHWALLKILFGEDLLNFLVKVKISDFMAIFWVTVEVLQLLILLLSKLKLLSIKSGSELSGVNDSFA